MPHGSLSPNATPAPETLKARLELVLGSRPINLTRLHGGCVALVYRVTLADGRVVVAKVDDKEDASLGLEAAMLRYLKEKSALPVPEVVYDSDTLLALQNLPGESAFSPPAERHAAELLAALHAVRADAYGFPWATLAGPLPQPNPPTASWVDFFRDHRLLYMTRLTLKSGRLPERVGERVEHLAENLQTLLDEPPYPSLIHGDVWTSNVLAQGGRVTGFLDPSLYYADADMELAYIALFNSFGRPFWDAYGALRPVRPGFEARRDVYSLYPLLIHARLFGGGYARSVEETLGRLGY